MRSQESSWGRRGRTVWTMSRGARERRCMIKKTDIIMPQKQCGPRNSLKMPPMCDNSFNKYYLLREH
jgi:hypothetical protein